METYNLVHYTFTTSYYILNMVFEILFKFLEATKKLIIRLYESVVLLHILKETIIILITQIILIIKIEVITIFRKFSECILKDSLMITA